LCKFAPTAPRLFIDGFDGAWLLDTQTWQPIRKLDVEPFEESRPFFSSDGEKLLIISGSGGAPVEISLFNPDTGERLKRFWRDLPIADVKFDADGRIIGIVWAIPLPLLWDLQADIQIRQLALENSPRIIRFSPDGQLIAAGNDDGTVTLLDAQTGEPLTTFRGHENRIGAIAFSNDGKLLASMALWDKTIHIWDVQKSQMLQKIQANSFSVVLRFSPDNKNIVSLKGTQFEIWEIQTGQLLHSMKAFEPITRFGGITSIDFSPDGRFFVAIAEYEYGSVRVTSNELKIWETATWKEIKYFSSPEGISSMRFSPDGRYILAAGGEDRRILIWDFQTQGLAKVYYRAVNAIDFSSDGSLVALGGSEDDYKTTIHAWRDGIGEKLLEIDEPAYPIIFGPNGILVTENGWSIKVWQTKTGELLRTFESHSSYPRALSPDGKTLISLDLYGGKVVFWDIQKGEITRTLDIARNSDIALSADGNLLALSEQPPIIQLRNPWTGELIKTFSEEKASYFPRFQFSPDGTILASGGSDSISLWDVQSGAKIVTLARYMTSHLSFSPDGRFLASTYGDGIVVWSIESNATSIQPQEQLRITWGKLKQEALLQNYPNPFNLETWIPYIIDDTTDATMCIYDSTGHVVREIELGSRSAGTYPSQNRVVRWDGRNDKGESVASGTYFYELRAGKICQVRRLIVIK
jgi:WD40 repeat protein